MPRVAPSLVLLYFRWNRWFSYWRYVFRLFERSTSNNSARSDRESAFQNIQMSTHADRNEEGDDVWPYRKTSAWMLGGRISLIVPCVARKVSWQ